MYDNRDFRFASAERGRTLEPGVQFGALMVATFVEVKGGDNGRLMVVHLVALHAWKEKL